MGEHIENKREIYYCKAVQIKQLHGHVSVPSARSNEPGVGLHAANGKSILPSSSLLSVLGWRVQHRTVDVTLSLANSSYTVSFLLN